MPRPRLTLGLLMAWIAFATVNLWAVGTAYSVLGWNSRSPQDWPLILYVLAWLAVVNLFGFLASVQLRAVRALRHDPRPDSETALTGRYIVLVITVVLFAVLAFPLILILAVLADYAGNR